MLGGQLTHSLLQSLCGWRTKISPLFSGCSLPSLIALPPRNLSLNITVLQDSVSEHRPSIQCIMMRFRLDFPTAFTVNVTAVVIWSFYFGFRGFFTNKKARRAGGIGPEHLTRWFRRGATVSESKMHHDVLHFQSWKSGWGFWKFDHGYNYKKTVELLSSKTPHPCSIFIFKGTLTQATSLDGAQGQDGDVFTRRRERLPPSCRSGSKLKG